MKGELGRQRWPMVTIRFDPMRSWTAIGIAASLACAVMTSVASAAPFDGGLSSGARAFEPAVRMMPPSTRCSAVVMIGDSLTAIRAQATPAAFAAIGMPVHVDAAVSRRVPEEVPNPWSGVKTVRQLKAAGIDAPCWVVALGSNDLFWVNQTPGYGPTPTGTVDNYLDWMLDEIRVDGPRRVWWVNMHHRKFVAESTIFNNRLNERVAADPGLAAIDWFTLSNENRQWFQDTVHVNAAGYDARAALVAAALDAS
jgi:hypothetical protein